MTRRPSSPLSGRLARGNAGAVGTSIEVPETIAGLLAWWDPAASYITKDGSDRVSAWVSREGNAYSVAQASSPAQPLWSGSGLLSKPALYFVTNDYLSAALSALETAVDGSAAYTLYAVVDGDDLVGTETMLSWGDTGTNVGMQFHAMGYGVATNVRAGRFDSGGNTQSDYAGARVAAPEYYGFIYDGSAYTIRAGGVASGSLANTRSFTPLNITTIGCRYYGGYNGFLDGWVGDLLVYDHALTAGEITTLEGWITAKYVGI